MLKHLIIFKCDKFNQRHCISENIRQEILRKNCIKGNCLQTALKTSFALSLGADILASTLRLF